MKRETPSDWETPYELNIYCDITRKHVDLILLKEVNASELTTL